MPLFIIYSTPPEINWKQKAIGIYHFSYLLLFPHKSILPISKIYRFLDNVKKLSIF